jgi:NTE family protein
MQVVQAQNRGKTALVLAGGGVTGAVYEIGALRAIDDLLVDRTVNDFDIYVGTSAGSLVASMLANGISPQEMMQTFEGIHPTMRPIQRSDIFAMSRQDRARWGWRVPRRLAQIGRYYSKHLNEFNFFDLAWSLVETLPPGLYDMSGLDGYVGEILSTPGHTNNYGELKRDLHIIATDLDTGERVVFGQGYRMDGTISQTVAASSSVPLLYRPFKIGNTMLIDGGIRGTASLDLAIENGATMIVCVNPLVPYDNSNWGTGSFFHLEEGGYLDKKGMQAVAAQVSRIGTHAGLHYHIKMLRRLHPEVDIIVIEPRADDCQMFYYNIMHYAVRLLLAKHGFESVTMDLAEDYPRYKQVLARHGVPISRRLVVEELTEIRESGYNPKVVRAVLEKRSPASLRSCNDTPLCELTRTLAELEMTLDNLTEAATMDLPLPVEEEAIAV